jgi:hypothetical protein
MLVAACPSGRPLRHRHAISGERRNLSTQKSPIETIETIFPEIGNMADTLAASETRH